MPQIALYRMALPDHVCPYGLRARRMLDEAGVAYQEHVLRSRDEVGAFKAEHRVATTPQVFVDGKRIGGSRDVERWLAGQTESG